MTNPSRTGTMAGLSWAKAERAKGASVRPTTPPNAPFTIVLRSNTCDLARAVAEALHLQARLVEHREVQVRNRRAFGQIDLPAALELAGAAADEDVRQRIIGVHVAVGHVGAVEQHRVVEQRAFAVGCFRQLRDELREPLQVIALDFDQLLYPIDMIGMM